MSFDRLQRDALAVVRERVAQTASCVTPVPIVLTTRNRRAFELSFPPTKEYVRLAIEPRLWLQGRHNVEAGRNAQREQWRMIVTGYHYEVREGRTEAESKQVIAFDWHPDGRSIILMPHVHIHSEGTRLSRKHHIPTGPVSFAAVVRFLIAELGVAPVRDDWQTVLTTNEQGK